MLYREIARIVGGFLRVFAFTLLLPFVVAVYYEFWVEPGPYPLPTSSTSFFVTFLLTYSLAFFLKRVGGKASGVLFRREGLVAVVLLWFLIPVLAALPFLFNQTFKNPFEAIFETTSGLTTTGASVVMPKRYNLVGKEIPYLKTIHLELETEYEWYGNIEPIRNEQGVIVKEGLAAMAKGIVFWRSFLQWLGGLGIVVLFVAILPALGVGTKVLFHSELTGPIKESMAPRIQETAFSLLKIYISLTFAQTALMILFNSHVSLFDASCISFATLSTGGFAPIDGSIGAYSSVSLEWIVTIFMILGGINFALYSFVLKGKLYKLADIELWVYLILIGLSAIFVATYLLGLPYQPMIGATDEINTIGDSIRKGLFQVVSAITSTGFSIENYDRWPYPSQALMLILIFVGGMAGSTSGGLKVIRSIMTFRIIQDKVELLFRPETVRSFRIGNKLIDSHAMMMVLSFVVTFLGISIVGTFLLILDGMDPETALTIIASTINNSGMGFREAGPTDSFAFLSNFGLSLTTIFMILGRLEVFTVLVILVPAFWKD